jgi:hypothetical protein
VQRAAILAGWAYLVLYLPLMWPAQPADRDEWISLAAPLPLLLTAVIWGFM